MSKCIDYARNFRKKSNGIELEMWLLLLIVTVDAIIGTPDVKNMDSIEQRLEDINKDINSAKLLRLNYNDKKDNDFQKDTNKQFVEGLKNNLWYVLKNKEILPAISLLYLPTNKRSLKSNEYDSSEEMKNPFLNRCNSKRVSYFISPKNERSIRMPFNSWGGKRGHFDDPTDYLMIRSSKSFSDKDNQKSFYEYVKRLPNFGRRTPFYSWGGKRNINTDTDLNKNIDTTEEKNELYLQNEDTKEDTILDGTEDDKRAAQMKTSKSRIGFNSWGGKKRNDDKESHLPSTNESISFEDVIERNIDTNDHQLQILEKKAINEYSRRFYFQPWDGKRSTSAEVVIIPNNYDLHGYDPTEKRKIFFPWGG